MLIIPRSSMAARLIELEGNEAWNKHRVIIMKKVAKKKEKECKRIEKESPKT